MPQFLITLVVMVVLNVVVMLLTPKRSAQPQQEVQAPAAPRPSDGSYALKQNVPSLTEVMGDVKKAGDYTFLEELNGTAYHVMAMAGHRIQGIIKHYLHDEEVTLTGTLVTAPEHFGTSNVSIASWNGLDAETANAALVATFPGIWTNDHRGDGIARVEMAVGTVPQEDYLKVYPQQMPQHSAIMAGALLYDPRNEAHNSADPNSWTYSRNLALMRIRQLTRPSGGKLSFADLYMPEWVVAADVADETVLNRTGGEEPRYHGGIWYRYENDPVEIGRLLDQAAEMVVYERPDGLIGVHAGRMVTPDIRITEKEILVLRYDANASEASTVLAVRGRWTDPAAVYNTVDAAIYGDPYTGDDDTQRTKTVDNQVIRYHNHIQRLQKLAFIRANAARINVKIPYDAASPTRNVPYRRFVRVHYPARGLDEAVVEIMDRPKLSLRNLTIEFDAIVVPSALFGFVASIEEGIPGGAIESVTPGAIPVPTGFAVAIGAETLAGGQSAAFALGSWDFLSTALTYELEYQLDDLSEPPRSAMSKPGDTEVRTQHIKDGAVYRLRLRTWSNNVASDWTAYVTATASADPTAPGQPFNFSSSKAGTNVTTTWINPNSPNLFKTELYRGTTASFGSAVLIYTAYGGIAEGRTFTDFALAPGTYRYWVRSFNASRVFSTEVGPTTQTI